MTQLDDSRISSVGRPSDAIDEATWDGAHAELIRSLQALIRIRSVNPPGDEILAARYVEGYLRDLGLTPEVIEPFPGRGSISVRLRGDGTGGGPFLLLSHLDVVPAPPEQWSRDPFGGDVHDGYVWGRGAVDMKGMVALELAVLRRLTEEARAAGLDPARDPIPGLRRDVLFTSTADEEAGGFHGAAWVAEHRPELLLADGAVNEAGGVSLEIGGHRFYPIQVGEKGQGWYRLIVRGRWGHGSMPGNENAAVRAAEVVRRLAEPGRPTVTPTMARFFGAIADRMPPRQSAAIRALAGSPGPDGRAAESAADMEEALAALCSEPYRRAARALVRDTISPNVIHAGVKTNVIPGVAEIEIDCRPLPGVTDADIRANLLERIGPDLAEHVEIVLVHFLPGIEQPVDHPLYRLLEDTIRGHDPDGIPLPVMAPFGTDAKHTAKLGVPTFGFSPLRLGPDDRFLELFHGDDERVGVEALQFGLPVLYDVVRGFCG